MRTVTIKLDEKIKKRMTSVTINWSEYIRRAIVQRIEMEERKKAAALLLDSLQHRQHRVPKGFINEAIRESRKNR